MTPLAMVDAVAAALPSAGGVRAVVGYGSGVFEQAGARADDLRLLDLLLIVDDTVAWHAQALRERPQDYPVLARAAGARRVARLGAWGGGHLWFNTDVQVQLPDGRQVPAKYGVAASEHVLRDLNTWDALYLSGRLHKPVRFVRGPEGDDLRAALDTNLCHAWNTALFLLPRRFSEMQLYQAIAALSYSGDVRMALAESPDKVDNIVAGSLKRFRELYAPFVRLGQSPAGQPVCAKVAWLGAEGDTQLEQDDGPAARAAAWSAMPLANGKYDRSNYPAHKFWMSRRIAQVVAASSRQQSAKGLLTAGPTKSIRYGLRKVAKRFR